MRRGLRCFQRVGSYSNNMEPQIFRHLGRSLGEASAQETLHQGRLSRVTCHLRIVMNVRLWLRSIPEGCVKQAKEGRVVTNGRCELGCEIGKQSWAPTNCMTALHHRTVSYETKLVHRYTNSGFIAVAATAIDNINNHRCNTHSGQSDHKVLHKSSNHPSNHRK